MTTFAKFFKKKHNKENDEPNLQNEKTNDFFSKGNKLNKVSSVYDGYPVDLTAKNLSENTDLNKFQNIENSQWKYKSPYWKITEPKTKSSSRSVPGVSTYSSFQTSKINKEYKHFSPPSKSESRFQNLNYSTILEIPNNYKNCLNNNSVKKDSIRAAQNADKNISQYRNSLREYNNKPSSSYRNSSNLQYHQNFNPYETELNYRRVFKNQKKAYYNKHSVTSEYGSADPSPTNDFSSTLNSKNFEEMMLNDENLFENTDYESDSEDTMPSNLVYLCEKQLKLVNNKCRKYKERVKYYKNDLCNIRNELVNTKTQLIEEKKKNKLLSLHLVSAQKEIERFREFINLQFRSNLRHVNQKNLQEQTNKNECFFENFYKDSKENLLQKNYTHNKSKQEENVNESFALCGAGEAMCSRTELALNLTNSPDETKNFLLNSLNKQKQANASSTIKKQIINENSYEKKNELNSVSQLNTSANDENLEQSRNCLTSPLKDYLSPPIKSKYIDQESIDDDHVAKKINLDILSIELNKSFLNNKENELHLLANNSYCVDEKSENLQNNLNQETNVVTQEKNIIKKILSTPMVPKKTILLKRSFSDTDVFEIKKDNFKIENLSTFEEKIECDECVNNELIENLNLKEKKINNLKKFRKSCNYNYILKQPIDYSSSYSSDDDAIRILARQLHFRGDIVHFRPPRKNLLNCERNLYRRFGTGERKAIAAFEYLKDISTDVSGILSSPDSHSN